MSQDQGEQALKLIIFAMRCFGMIFDILRQCSWIALDVWCSSHLLGGPERLLKEIFESIRCCKRFLSSLRFRSLSTRIEAFGDDLDKVS